MEYTLSEGKKLKSTYKYNGFRYVKARESSCSVYLKCALFRTHICRCVGKINKLTDLLEISSIQNHDANTYND